MKTINEVMRILGGSKQYKFDRNEDGYSCVLVITSYYSREQVKLDLSRLTPDMLDELQVEENKDDNID